MKFLNKVKEKEPKYVRLLEITEYINNEKTKNELRKQMKGIDIEKLKPIEFEEFIAALFEKMGYMANTTKGSGDFGCDIIAKNEGETVVIQVKKYKKKVNLKAVQEVVGAKNHFSADRAIVITTSDFLKSAKDLAKSNNVELWNGNKLREAILREL